MDWLPLKPTNCSRNWNVTQWGRPLCPIMVRDMEWLFYYPVLIGLVIIGSTSNVLIVVVSMKRMSPLRLIMIFVAITDTLQLLSFLVYYLPRQLQSYYHSDWLQEWANLMENESKIFYILHRFCRTSSIWSVVLLLGERFTKMWKPEKWYKLFSNFAVLIHAGVITFLAGLIWIPGYQFLAVLAWRCADCKGAIGYKLLHDNWSFHYGLTKFQRLLCLFLLEASSINLMIDFGLPFSLLAIMMFLIRLKQSDEIEEEKKSKERAEEDYNETDMINRMVTLFMVLELANYFMYWQLGNWQAFQQVRLARVIGLSSTCVKLFVYLVYGNDFRKTTSELFSMRRCERKGPIEE